MKRNKAALETRPGLVQGALILNADDWGRDPETTDRIFECFRHRVISSASAMVFMGDSERASAKAQEFGLDIGLHLNLTEPFSSQNCPARLLEHQRKLGAYLRGQRFAPAVFHPLLVRDFDYVVKAQLGEFHRVYGAEPRRLDGHHHMHLCANVLFQTLLPAHTVVRRNFTFQRGEKSILNRFYRRAVDSMLARRHLLVDHFFQLEPIEPVERLRKIFSLARQQVVEIETHPVKPDEFRFLTLGEILTVLKGIPISPRFALGPSAVEREAVSADSSTDVSVSSRIP